MKPLRARQIKVEVARAHSTIVSATPGASAASFSSVAAPGGTETSSNPKRTEAKTASQIACLSGK